MVQALDALVKDRFGSNPDFRGLTCLEHCDRRGEIVVVILWEGDGLGQSKADDDRARQLISEGCAVGEDSREYLVLRQFHPGLRPEAQPEELAVLG